MWLHSIVTNCKKLLDGEKEEGAGGGFWSEEEDVIGQRTTAQFSALFVTASQDSNNYPPHTIHQELVHGD